MKQGSTSFLKIVIWLIAVVTLSLMLWFPQIEGRNANADQFSIYFRDPFLAYTYLASVPFFVALWQALKLLQNIEMNRIFSEMSIRSVKVIKYCAVTLALSVVVGVLSLVIFTVEDRPPLFAMGLIFTFFFSVIGTAAAVLQKLLQSVVDIKSENDLTV